MWLVRGDMTSSIFSKMVHQPSPSRQRRSLRWHVVCGLVTMNTYLGELGE